MVLERTKVVRPPRQSLETFGVTKIRYHLVTEPAFGDVNPVQTEETVVRGGVVKAERPQVVTPYFLLKTESFSAGAREFLEDLARTQGQDSPGLLYSYKNEPGGMDIVSGGVDEVATRIARDLDARESGLEAVIIGIDELWDVSLIKFIYELTNDSARKNVAQMRSAGMMEMNDGVPSDARRRVERMLEGARQGQVEPSEVMRELKRWDLFEEYEDRFLALFRT